MTNYKVLSLMRLIKSTVEIFVYSFFIMYFLDISNNNILKLGLYYIIVNTVIFITIFALKNVCKTEKRVSLLRIGIVLNLLYFLLIILLREQLVNYIYLMGIIYGLEEGFYYSIYNNLESSGIKNSERAKFTGIFTALKSIVNIVIPLIFGSVITNVGFSKCTLIIVILTILQLILSFLYKDIKLEDKDKIDYIKYHDMSKKIKIIKNANRLSFFNGFIFAGAFNTIVTIYIIKVMSSNFDLGVFTSLFAIITSILGILFAKIIPKEKYSFLLKISAVFTIFGIILLIYKVNFITVLLFNFFQVFTATLCTLIIGVSVLNISNHNDIKNKYKVEYFIGIEANTFVGRVLGNILLIIMGISSTQILTNGILLLFGGIILLLTYFSSNISKEIINNNSVEC